MKHRGNLVAIRMLIIVIGLLPVACSSSGLIVDPDRSLLIPIGRSFVGASGYALSLNDVAFDAERFYDGLGGYWLKIPLRQLQQRTKVRIQVIRRKDESPVPFNESGIDANRWIRPSTLIDSDQPDIKNKAGEIIAGCATCRTNAAKAEQIQTFVIQHMRFSFYDGFAVWKASESYQRRYGICIDYARLFVSLCRAAGIPARTVEGIVHSRENPATTYDGHHEWAEFMDENYDWHPLDLTYSTAIDLSDIRYLDLIYASEENPYYRPFHETDFKPYLVDTGDVVVYSVERIVHDGFPGLGYRLTENRSPLYLKVENEFFCEITGDRLHITRQEP